MKSPAITIADTRQGRGRDKTEGLERLRVIAGRENDSTQLNEFRWASSYVWHTADGEISAKQALSI